MQHTHLTQPILLNNSVNNNCQQLQVNSSSPGSTTSDSDNHLNNIHSNIANNQGSNNNYNEGNMNMKSLQGHEHMDTLQQKLGKQIIAKPLPSRPTPFIAHNINHPHLHSLLAHCRNPYISGKFDKNTSTNLYAFVLFA